jgi:hypothetical protein
MRLAAVALGIYDANVDVGGEGVLVLARPRMLLLLLASFRRSSRLH